MNAALKSLMAAAAACADIAHAAPPVSLHPDNPHYFLFRGRPTLLISSGEHYGALLNAEFDCKKYLDTLAEDGLNLTRTFSGVYAEPAGAFNIACNTLAPASGQLLCPWARSDTPGYAGGGCKFDLEKWDPEYFKRLHQFVSYAAQKGVVVEFTLFCTMYSDEMWNLSPMNASNNVNGIGGVGRLDVFTGSDPRLFECQKQLVRKIVRELAPYDNVMYEICNEPYFNNVQDSWQRAVSAVITETEKELGVSHLITQNIANQRKKITDPDPNVSVFNFHYAFPPDTVAENYALNKPIGDNETGFNGTADGHYRMEAWCFILSGGALFNNLDYSFAVGFEDGTYDFPRDSQPGGGGPALRRQLGFLASFMSRIDFVKMSPAGNAFSAEASGGGKPVQAALRAANGVIAAYVKDAASCRAVMPEQFCRAEWFDAAQCRQLETVPQHRAENGIAVLNVPQGGSGEYALILTPVSMPQQNSGPKNN